MGVQTFGYSMLIVAILVNSALRYLLDDLLDLLDHYRGTLLSRNVLPNVFQLLWDFAEEKKDPSKAVH